MCVYSDIGIAIIIPGVLDAKYILDQVPGELYKKAAFLVRSTPINNHPVTCIGEKLF